jgi:oxalate decarboxylase
MQHHLSLHKLKPQDKSEGGYRTKATKSNFPALQKMSFYKLTLYKQSVREPHWHANADELGYCLKGNLLISIYGNKNTKETFLIREGDAFFIPSGALHSLENIGQETAEAILQFSHEEPEDFALSSALGMFSNAVLGNTWNVPAIHFKGMKRLSKEAFAAKVKKSTSLSKDFHYTSAYQFPLESSLPLFSNEVGKAKAARNNVWPVLQRQALFSLQLTGKGMREPHWHPETAEMGYVASGNGRMSILSPSGKIDTYHMQPGDIYFIPKAYPHHIENLKSSELHLLIFFDQAMPQDIGFTGSVKSFSDEALSGVMHCERHIFAKLPTYYEDQFIVKKKNPLDR